MMRLVTGMARGALGALGARRGPGARLWVLAVAAAATMLAAGCGTAVAPPAGGGGTRTATKIPSSPVPVSSSAAPVPTTTAGPPSGSAIACAGWPAHVVEGKPPASFVPVAVIRCVNGFQMIPGKGEWQTATLERADRNLAPLIAALRHPSMRRAPSTICPEIAMLAPEIVLLGRDGQAFLPALPVTACGLVQPPVLAALAALPWQKVSVRLVAQVQTQQQVASGCAPQPADPFTLYGPLRPSAGGAVFPVLPASLRVCAYSAGSAAGAPRFTGSATLTGATERELLAGLSGAGRAALCTLPEPGFAVVGGPGATQIYVELGGCHRVLRSQSQAGGLTGMSTGQATPGAVATIESVTAGQP
jgi:hypothetical protein